MGERKVASALLADYPFAGLLTVAELAKRANVSGQTILRLACKLGFEGYGDFQRHLIGEIKERYHSPVLLRQARGDGGQAFLGNLAESAVRSIWDTVAAVPDQQLMAISALLSDRRRTVFMLGGRMTDSLAGYFLHHLRQIRPKVHRVSRIEEEWPEYLLRMGRNDLLVMFDYRRYQPDLLRFSKRASRQRKAQIILFTDKWLSPISKYSSHILPAAIDVGTPWDTAISTLLLIEGLINHVSEADWSETRSRIEAWEQLRVSATCAPRDPNDE